MKTCFIFCLLLSLTANAWLWARASSARSGMRAAGSQVASGTHASDVSATAVRDSAVARRRLVALLDTSDPALMRDRLRAAGFDESSIRAVIDGMLRVRYREQVAAWRIDRIRTAWWRGNAAGGGNAPSQRKGVTEPLQAVLGVDPLELADAEVRYDFLPPDMRRLLAQIDLDYTELKGKAAPARGNPATKSELDEDQLLNRERQKDVLAALTPEERAEYELRFAGTAATNARRFFAMDVTESEFRVIKPLVDTYREQLGAMPRDTNAATARVELDQRTIDQLVAAVGYDRALDYLWATDSGPWMDTVRLLQGMQFPTGNASRLFQLAAETGDRASAIHYDTLLTVEQKRAALETLQQSVRPQIDALVPAVAQARLPPEAMSWFNALGEGRYERNQPLLMGAGRMVATPVSVAVPPRGPHVPVPLAHPGGR